LFAEEGTNMYKASLFDSIFIALSGSYSFDSSENRLETALKQFLGAFTFKAPPIGQTP
jgi:hypothetical protein